MKRNNKQYRKKKAAQVTENTLLGIVGNSWVLPVAHGTVLDNIHLPEGETLYSLLKDEVPAVVTRISLPTPGIYAETHLSECDACEKVADDTSQDWKLKSPSPSGKAGLGLPTAIKPLDTASRYQNPGNLQTKDMQQPIINIQN